MRKHRNSGGSWRYAIWCNADKGYDGYSLGLTPDEAWRKFRRPALKKSAYQAKGSGYKCKRVSLAMAEQLKLQ